MEAGNAVAIAVKVVYRLRASDCRRVVAIVFVFVFVVVDGGDSDGDCGGGEARGVACGAGEIARVPASREGAAANQGRCIGKVITIRDKR
jgi:hypothetical protein